MELKKKGEKGTGFLHITNWLFTRIITLLELNTKQNQSLKLLNAGMLVHKSWPFYLNG